MDVSISFAAPVIAALVGTLLALFFAYFPKVRVWFASLETDKQSLLRLGLLLLAEIVICLLSYFQVIVTEPPFSWKDALAIAFALIISNAPVQQLLPATKDVIIATQAKMLSLLK